MIKINRCWRKFVVLFRKACYFLSQEFSAQHVEWVVIRGISGYADGTEVKENWQTFASVTAASFVVSILNQGNDFEDWPHYQGEQINFYLS